MSFFPFARRTYKEFLRDPVSMIFGAAFPVILMIVLQIICKNLTNEGMEIASVYQIDKMMIGISIYSFSFTSFYAGIRVSKDKNDYYIQRFYSTNMELDDYILGYVAPLLFITFLQSIVCITTAFLLDAILSLDILHFGLNYLLLIGMMLPCEIIFICIGIMLGVSFKAKESIYIFIGIIIVTILTSNIFFNVSSFGSAYVIFCRALPFYPTYEALVGLLNGFTEAFPYYFVTIAYGIILFILMIIIFKRKMNR